MEYPFDKYLKQEHIVIPGFTLVDKEQGVAASRSSYSFHADGDTTIKIYDGELTKEQIGGILKINISNRIVTALLHFPKRDPRTILNSSGKKYAVCSLQYGLLQAASLHSQQLEFGLETKSIPDLRLREPRIIFHKGGIIYLDDDKLCIGVI